MESSRLRSLHGLGLLLSLVACACAVGAAWNGALAGALLLLAVPAVGFSCFSLGRACERMDLAESARRLAAATPRPPARVERSRELLEQMDA